MSMLERLERLSPRKLALLVLDLQSKLDAAARRERTGAIAIIGIGCRFPGGADTPERFWHLLRTGQHVVSEIPADRWDTHRYFDADPEAPGKMYARHAGFIEEVDRFDPGFFGISPREAASMDPQHRVLLEVAWEALERAGQNPAALSGTKTGVFVGITTTDYAQVVGAAGPKYADGYLMTGTALNFAAGRLSYVLGLQGPCLAVDTACSSSLTAIHLACRSLRSGDCDLALAGGVNLILRPDGMVVASKAGMLSTAGVCRTFDAAADGIVRAEGCGVLVLKPLEAAVAGGDPVLAVVRGSAINQDGRSSGITVPNGLAQEALIRDALRDAGLQPRDLSYVEAHGTGTRIGDPIEVRALGAVLAEGRPADDPLLLGSVKTNIGHAESAAGVAGAIKVALALQHREIPPHLHLERLNPDISLEQAKAVVPTRVTPLTAARPIAGVSSFGASGTNVHVILEAAPEVGVHDGGDRNDRPLHLLTLSARSESALAELERRYDAFLAERHPVVADLCFTANTGRAHLPHRRAFLADSAEGLREALNASANRGRRSIASGVVPHGGRPKIAFLFTGQGSQYVGMGRQLYETQAVFRAVLDRCDAVLRSELPVPLLSVLYDDGPSSPLGDTQYTQPALFAVQCALAELWRTWGVEPSAVLGHSVGEYAAACVAGRLSLEDGLRLIAARGRLMQALPRVGAMAAVFAAPPAVQAAVDARAGLLSIAALNGPENTVISGDADALRSAIDELSRSGIRAQRLDVSHAFHSALMEPMLDEFERAARNVSYERGRLGFVSNLTGTVADPAFELTAQYWREHARQPVRFAEGMSALLGQGYTYFVEIGPHPTLVALGRRIADAHDAVWMPSLRRGTPDWRQMLDTLAQLYVRGVPIDWPGFDKPYVRRKLILPTYPFQRERHWITPAEDGSPGSAIHTVAWRDRAPQGNMGAAHGTWVVFGGGDDVAAALARRLDAEGAQTIVAPREIVRTEGGVERWWLEHASGIPVDGVAYFCAPEGSPGASADLLTAQRQSCGGLLDVVRAMAKRAVNPPRLWVITRGSQNVLGGEASAAHAAAWGLGGTIANEHPEWRPVRIDLDPAEAYDLDLLCRELLGDAREDRVAFRGGRRYAARLVRGRTGSARATAIHADASYLITGGCGALGLAVARWLVARGAKNVALAGRRAPSPAAQTAIDALASTGARVIACQADITKPAEAARLLQQVDAGLAPVRGLVHAAGILDDGVLVQQTWERFERVLAPKVLGAANLHEATRDRPLDFFVLFSSMSALLGTPGQGNYAAANAWLDAFASECRRRGQPAISINWGPWADGGMAGDLARSHQQRWAARGVRLLSPDAGTRGLHTLLDSGLAHAAIFDVDWEAFLGGPGKTPPFLDELHTRRPGAPEPDPAPAVVLLAADGSVRPAVAEAFCREVVAASHGVPAASVDVQ
jgi:acyl transferase domain-containing protein